MVLSQGRQANKTGRQCEAVVAAVLDGSGITYRRQVTLDRPSIYGGSLRADFYCTNVPGFPDGLCIEAKWQDEPGSVYEKFPYLWENIRTQYPCPVIVVADGRKMHPGGIAWLKERIDGEHLVAVLTIAELMTWTSRMHRLARSA